MGVRLVLGSLVCFFDLDGSLSDLVAESLRDPCGPRGGPGMNFIPGLFVPDTHSWAKEGDSVAEGLHFCSGMNARNE